MTVGAIIGLLLFVLFLVLFRRRSARNLQLLDEEDRPRAIRVLSIIRVWSNLLLMVLFLLLYLAMHLYADQMVTVLFGYLLAVAASLAAFHFVLRYKLVKQRLPRQYIDGVLYARHLLYMGLASLLICLIAPLML